MTTELLHRATDYARGVLSELTDDDLRRPTPCEGWDAGRVVLHLADVIDGLIGLLENGELALPQPPRINDPDPVAIVDERLVELERALHVGAGAKRVDHALLAGAIELTTHGWDIGVACDRAHRIPDSLAEEVLAQVSAVLHVDARGANFAAPVDTARDAPASDRLIAFLGRVPRH
ncbi:uncharacterized protein (TIGR03086 family) [Kineococcus xinjiangensis]|uniref:Uncharacterized protein (TIGR03086 family) n=1 Tax=Kineococcus xinjiangensis TaxID=512762 RepID=A0A2S6IBZ0_9ACTN|nr:TIGR03086 family metal-binding protein [Kineococcus xinjiangensis]PPK90163.1 uncharacterized protein (TIGR03086 family) [Kineococcus xinjiangensis]